MMIHDSHRRLVTAHGTLVQLLVSNIHPKREIFLITDMYSYSPGYITKVNACFMSLAPL